MLQVKQDEKKTTNQARKKHLLIISCSMKKKQLMESPAIEVYDGPYYKILRKERKESLDIFIISAKYGLIHPETKISYYERKMTTEEADRNRSSNDEVIFSKISNLNYDQILVVLGKTYRKSIDIEKLKRISKNVLISEGPIGIKLHDLKHWLHELPENE